MLFRVESGKSVFDTAPEVLADNVFKETPERTLKYIFLYYDYRSPYRKMHPKKRRRICLEIAGFKFENRKDREPHQLQQPDKTALNVANLVTKSAKLAHKRFMDIQYDEDMETLKSYDKQLSQFRSLLNNPAKTESEFKIAMTVMEKYPKFVALRKELADVLELSREEIEEVVEETNEEPQEELSTIDKLNMGLI